MSEFIQGATVAAVFRSLTVLCGLGALFMGYRLFTLGVYERAGELKAAWGERNLLLRQAAPGTFFALFGAVIVVSAIYMGLGVSRTLGSPTPEPSPDSVAAEASQTVLRSANLSRVNLIDQRYKDRELTATQAYEELYRLVTEGDEP